MPEVWLKYKLETKKSKIKDNVRERLIKFKNTGNKIRHKSFQLYILWKYTDNKIKYEFSWIKTINKFDIFWLGD